MIGNLIQNREQNTINGCLVVKPKFDALTFLIIEDVIFDNQVVNYKLE